jgi:chromosome segregation ATPase
MYIKMIKKKDLEEKVKKLTEMLDESDLEIDNLNNKNREYQMKYNDSLKKIEQDLKKNKDLEDLILHLETTISNYKINLSNLEIENKNLKENKDKKDSILTPLLKDTNQNKIKELEAELAEYQLIIDNLKNKNKELEITNIKLEKDYKNHVINSVKNTEIVSIGDEIGGFEKEEIASLKKEIGKLISEKNELNLLIFDLKNNINFLENEKKHRRRFCCFF